MHATGKQMHLRRVGGARGKESVLHERVLKRNRFNIIIIINSMRLRFRGVRHRRLCLRPRRFYRIKYYDPYGYIVITLYVLTWCIITIRRYYVYSTYIRLTRGDSSGAVPSFCRSDVPPFRCEVMRRPRTSSFAHETLCRVFAFELATAPQLMTTIACFSRWFKKKKIILFDF